MNKIRGSNKKDRIQDTEKSDLIIAKDGDDRILTQGGEDLIKGGSGNDRVYAIAGDEFSFVGGTGRDALELYAKPGHTPAVLKANGEIVGVSFGNHELIELDGVEAVHIHYVNDWPF